MSSEATSCGAENEDLCAECHKRPRGHHNLCLVCANDWDDDDGDEIAKICPYCCGTGDEPLDSFCTPCEHCDGTGRIDLI